MVKFSDINDDPVLEYLGLTLKYIVSKDPETEPTFHESPFSCSIHYRNVEGLLETKLIDLFKD